MEGASLRRYMAVSRASGIPFRMDEANSVSCGGRAGISNTFASALWAAAYIGQSMAAGVTGINFQGNPANCLGYAALCASTPARLAAGALSAQPLWYALLLTHGLVGDLPLHTTVRAPGSTNISVVSLLARDGSLHLLITEADPPGGPDAAVSLHLGSRYGAAGVLRLTAPELASTSGVTVGERAVAANGAWPAPAGGERVAPSAGMMTVRVPAGSAALVTIVPARAAPASG